MAKYRAPFTRAKGDKVAVRLRTSERQAIRGLAGELRELLTSESQASDGAVARLFPPAYREDPLRNFDYDRTVHDGLVAQRLAAIDVVQEGAGAELLTLEQAHTWLGVLNDLRLVLGARLDITEDANETTFQGDPGAAEAFGMYRWLAYLVGVLLEALDPTLVDLGAGGPPPETARD